MSLFITRLAKHPPVSKVENAVSRFEMNFFTMVILLHMFHGDQHIAKTRIQAILRVRPDKLCDIAVRSPAPAGFQFQSQLSSSLTHAHINPCIEGTESGGPTKMKRETLFLYV
jgi:hypothetical protein